MAQKRVDGKVQALSLGGASGHLFMRGNHASRNGCLLPPLLCLSIFDSTFGLALTELRPLCKFCVPHCLYVEAGVWPIMGYKNVAG